MSRATKFLAISSCLIGAQIALAQDDPPPTGSDLGANAISAELGRATPRQVRSVGTSSVTLRVEMGDVDGAYKPRTRTHQRGYANEIAAYRLARALDLDTVPPAVLRIIPRWVLQERFDGEDSEWEDIRNEIVWDNPGMARGAMIYWVPHLGRSDLDTPAGILRWSEWLAIDAEIPEESRELARDLSNMVVFDYLIANWDRFSGGNLSVNEPGTRLVVRDHNLSFAGLPLARYEHIEGELMRAQRFSRRTVSRVLALDEAALRQAMSVEGEEAPLDDRQIADVMRRKSALVTYWSALASVHGEEQVLFFE